MSAPIKVVDVPSLIAELRRQAGMRNATLPCVLLKDVIPQLDAVAELIAAVTEFRAAIAALVICQTDSAPEDIYEAVSALYLKANDRLDAALDRCGAA